jgi:hypothetical protein
MKDYVTQVKEIQPFIEALLDDYNSVSSNTLQQTNVISTFDGVDSLKFYVDGVSLQDLTQTYTATTTSSSVIIGQRQSGTNNIYAHIKDLRVYDFELNADEAGYLA